MRDDVLLVHEIYASVQGESTFVGVPCTFVRTTGCNLRCRWCDTTQAFRGGTKMALDEVLARALALDTPLVEVTGGEPLLQAGVPALLERLADAGKTVLLETSGERDISVCDPRVHRIVDLKAPGSGESHRIRWQNLEHLGPRDEVKMVLSGRGDYEWARDAVRRHGIDRKVREVLVSPVHGELDPADLVAWVLEDKLPVRVQVQLHKIIWGKDTQGV